MGKSMSQANSNGKRRIEAATGKKLAPTSLRKKHRYLDDCTDEELTTARIVRRTPEEIKNGE